jgi:NADH-quinone oxidoreductase subunit A
MSLAIYCLGVLLVAFAMLSSFFLGERGKGHGRASPYESGIKAFGSSRVRFFPHYFLVAILFVIFDLESVFLYIWSLVVREAGWVGFIRIVFFVGMLLLALAYAFSMGVLKFSSRSMKATERSL